MTTLLDGRNSTCRLPRFSALYMVLSASFRTLTRTMAASSWRPVRCLRLPCQTRLLGSAPPHTKRATGLRCRRLDCKGAGVTLPLQTLYSLMSHMHMPCLFHVQLGAGHFALFTSLGDASQCQLL
jgi:hypothetical protein